MLKPIDDFLVIATSGKVVKSSIKVSLVVGTLLALINHGEGIIQMSLSSENVVQILLTYFVPYGVSTYSSVKALRGHAVENA